MISRLPQLPVLLRGCRASALAVTFLFALAAAGADSTNSVSAISVSTNSVGATTSPLTLSGPLPDVGMSLLRVLGALAVVLAIFLGGVWLFRNWQRLTIQRGRAPKLNVIEVRSLGGRHALYVVGYEHERFLLAASPTGVNLLSHLQPAEPGTPDPATGGALPASFVQTLTQKLKGK